LSEEIIIIASNASKSINEWFIRLKEHETIIKLIYTYFGWK